MNVDAIKRETMALLASIPPHVQIVAAAKTRAAEEVRAAVDAGIRILGYNYLQEAQGIQSELGRDVQWHMIGHLQRNKVKKAVTVFDMIETVDSLRLAETIDRECASLGRKMPILIEINSGEEENKNGVFPQKVDALAEAMQKLQHIKLSGLMTMGPYSGDPEVSRPYFKKTRQIFERLGAAGYNNVEMQYLSMGMSNSYHVALEEGANIIRIGTKLFGARG